MKLDKKNFVLFLGIFFFIGLLLVVTLGSKDSEENQLERRLKAFETSLPADMKAAFIAGRYDEVKTRLAEKVGAYKAFLVRLPEDKQTPWLKAEYDGIDPAIVGSCPKDLRTFYKGYYRILDAECIQGFSEAEVVDFFRVYFVDRLAKIKEK